MSTGGAPPFIHTDATTASPAFIPAAIAPSPSLKAKSPLVVLTESPPLAHVFRESTMAPGQYSRDVYVWVAAMWKLAGKDSQKYAAPPFPPFGADSTQIEGVMVYTMKPLTPDELARLRELMPLLTR